ncbi:hypothetical protein SH661x_001943 [Planctomicrobium sp. SH661]|uniref:hypothetical protein n=1 Tax=Planctomicrobium sp. SH661 TaxID=3448124 RepID=UPI003F5C2BA6
MASGGAIRAGRAFVELFADSTQLKRGLAIVRQQFGAFRVFTQKMSFGIAGEVSGMFAALAPAGILAGLGAAARNFQQFGDQIDKTSKRTGMTAEQLTSLGYAATQAGASMTDVTSATGNLQDQLFSAMQGNDEARISFAQLGISIGALARMNPEQQFLYAAQALSSVRAGTLRAAAANRIFGSSGEALLPMIANGAKGIREMQKEAETLGLVMSQADASAAAEQLSAWTRLWSTMGTVGAKISAALAPMLTKLFTVVSSGIAVVVKWVDKNRGLVQIIAGVIAGVAAATAVVFALGVAFAVAGSIIGAMMAAVQAIGAALGIVSGVIMALVGSPFGLFLTAAAIGLSVLAAWAIRSGAAMDWLRSVFGPLYQVAVATFDAIKSALTAGDWGKAADVLWSTLKLAWVAGTGYLLSYWYKFKKGAVDIMIGLSTALSTAWVETISFLSNAWSKFIASFRKSWIDASTWLGNLLIDMNPYMTAEEKAVEKRDNNMIQGEKKQAIDRELEANLANRDEARRKRLEQIQSDQEGMLEANNEQYQSQVAASKHAMDEARTAWEKAVGEAKALGPQPGTPQLQLPGIASGMFQMQGTDKSGTFSQAASRMYPGVPGGNPMQRLGERILGETEKIRKGVESVNEVKL